MRKQPVARRKYRTAHGTRCGGRRRCRCRCRCRCNRNRSGRCGNRFPSHVTVGRRPDVGKQFVARYKRRTTCTTRWTCSWRSRRWYRRWGHCGRHQRYRLFKRPLQFLHLLGVGFKQRVASVDRVLQQWPRHAHGRLTCRGVRHHHGRVQDVARRAHRHHDVPLAHQHAAFPEAAADGHCQQPGRRSHVTALHVQNERLRFKGHHLGACAGGVPVQRRLHVCTRHHAVLHQQPRPSAFGACRRAGTVSISFCCGSCCGGGCSGKRRCWCGCGCGSSSGCGCGDVLGATRSFVRRRKQHNAAGTRRRRHLCTAIVVSSVTFVGTNTEQERETNTHTQTHTQTHTHTVPRH